MLADVKELRMSAILVEVRFMLGFDPLYTVVFPLLKLAEVADLHHCDVVAVLSQYVAVLFSNPSLCYL